MKSTITAAVVDTLGKIRSLVRERQPDEEVTEKQVTDAKVLARLQMRILRDLSAVKRRPSPRRIDFVDFNVVGDGTTKYIFTHLFGGRVRWWVTDCRTSDGALSRHDDTTADQLVLVSSTAGTVTLRVEEVG